MEKVYRACVRAKGWQRVQARTPAPNQFRGPEGDEEMSSLPLATSAPNEDAAATKCRANTNWNQSRLAARAGSCPRGIRLQDVMHQISKEAT